MRRWVHYTHWLMPGSALPLAMTFTRPYSQPAYSPTGAARCRVCGGSTPPGAGTCSRCSVPVGSTVAPWDPASSTYVALPRAGRAAAPTPARWHSGSASIHIVQDAGVEIPKGWNWGAAFLTLPWAAAHRLYWYLAAVAGLAFTLASSWALAYGAGQDGVLSAGVLTLVVAAAWLPARIWFGMRGSRLAWQSGRYATVRACANAQARWSAAGMAAAIVLVPLYVTGCVALLVYLSNGTAS